MNTLILLLASIGGGSAETPNYMFMDSPPVERMIEEVHAGSYSFFVPVAYNTSGREEYNFTEPPVLNESVPNVAELLDSPLQAARQSTSSASWNTAGSCSSGSCGMSMGTTKTEGWASSNNYSGRRFGVFRNRYGERRAIFRPFGIFRRR